MLHPKIGFSWEGMALEEIIRALKVESDDCYFWSTQSGAELDLLILTNGKKIGFEIKYTTTPKITKSMHIAIEDLNLNKFSIIIPGNQMFQISDNIKVYGIKHFVLEALKYVNN